MLFVFYLIALYGDVCIPLNCTVLYCIVLYYIVLYIVFYCEKLAYTCFYECSINTDVELDKIIQVEIEKL